MSKAQMSATAWETGARNAWIAGIGALMILLVHTLIFTRIAHLPIGSAIGVSLIVVIVIGSVALFVNLFLHRHDGGTILLDCGYHPMRWLYFLNACFMGWLAIMSRQTPCFGISSELRIAVYLVFTVMMLLLAFGRLQIREQGIWLYWGVMKWEQIKGYCWKDNKLVIEPYSKGLFSARGALPVPSECKETATAILRERMPAVEG